MGERVQVRFTKVSVTVTRDILVVLPEGCDEKEARTIIKEYDLNEITDGQDADVWVQGIETGSVNPEDADLYVITEDGLAPAGDTEWTEKFEKYIVKP